MPVIPKVQDITIRFEFYTSKVCESDSGVWECKVVVKSVVRTIGLEK